MTKVDAFFSPALGEKTPYMIIIPDSVWGQSDIPYVQILHGMTDDVTMWLRMTRIEELLEQHCFAVALTFAENSYYTDMAHGKRYLSCVADDFPEFLSERYGFTRSREKRGIMGNSMGGYGAFKLALTYPDRYCAAVSFSGVMDIVYRFCECGFWREHGRANWGDDYIETMPDSPSDLYRLVRDLEASDKRRPVLHQTCGTEDYLYHENERFYRFMLSRGGWNFGYSEGKGTHWWDFWDRQLPHALMFFTRELHLRSLIRGPML